VLKELMAIRQNTEAILGMLRASGVSGSPTANGRTESGGAIADARDLDGQYGNPTIKFDPKPKYWTGPSFVGYRYSECSAEYLDAVAKYLDACAYMKRKDGGPDAAKQAGYKEKDAARARGWAARARTSQPQSKSIAESNGGDWPAQVERNDGQAPPDAYGGDANEQDIPF
jgi:hypothetical protein